MGTEKLSGADPSFKSKNGRFKETKHSETPEAWYLGINLPGDVAIPTKGGASHVFRSKQPQRQAAKRSVSAPNTLEGHPNDIAKALERNVNVQNAIFKTKTDRFKRPNESCAPPNIYMVDGPPAATGQMSATFKSKVERFKYPKTTGPGMYEYSDPRDISSRVNSSALSRAPPFGSAIPRFGEPAKDSTPGNIYPLPPGIETTGKGSSVAWKSKVPRFKEKGKSDATGLSRYPTDIHSTTEQYMRR
eukprot:NODE_2685_length_882_cov_61.086435_g2213_i0.p2 GENE.NODE_2685_length_882_cov_61.086435_g2213_i0~~NODE_2685_length_882_cov_61.086435_g2213_i0.p2  ORF type:complete len:246 (-),score=63.39 NODE_2685_length_882_cov_61.086435_g2213_i0:113-850(-)